VVIKSSEGLDGTDLRRAVGHFGAAAVAALIEPRDVVALAGGRTIHELVQHLPAVRTHSLTIVQAMGSVDSSVSVFDAQEVGRVMAQRLGGIFLSLNTPASSPKNARAMRCSRWRRSAVSTRISIAPRSPWSGWARWPTPCSSSADPRWSDDSRTASGRSRGRGLRTVHRRCRQRMPTPGATASSVCRSPTAENSPGRRHRLCSDRTAAIRAAIAGGVIKSLVIDELGAGALLASAPLRPRKNPDETRRK